MTVFKRNGEKRQTFGALASPGFRGVPLNYQEQRIYHWHETLDRRIGVDRIPERLRVPPVLDAWIE